MEITHSQVANFYTPSRFEGASTVPFDEEISEDMKLRHLWRAQYTQEELHHRAVAYISNDIAYAKGQLTTCVKRLSEVQAEIHDLIMKLNELRDVETSYEDLVESWTQKIRDLPQEINLYSPDIICWSHEQRLPF